MFSLFLLFAQAVYSERSFKIVGDEFQMDGKTFQYISGSVHYFRIDPEYWEDVLTKVAHGGCNCVQTYVAWNIHEPKKGQFHFTGLGDIEKFVSLCEKLGQHVRNFKTRTIYLCRMGFRWSSILASSRKGYSRQNQRSNLHVTCH